LRAATGLDLNHDLLSWIGDAAFFVGGESKKSIQGGALIHSANAATSKATLAKLGRFAAHAGGGTKASPAGIPGATGFRLSDSSAPAGVYLLQTGDVVILAYGENAARAAVTGSNGITSAPDFRRAATGLGPGFAPSLYVSMPPIFRLAAHLGARKSKGYA